MRIPLLLRGALIALAAMLGVGLHSAIADSGNIALTVYKGGWIIGGSAGSGALYFRGRTYGLGVGGLDYGLVFGGSKTVLRGRVSNIRRASDVAGVYAAAGAGLQSAAVSARLCSLIRTALFWSSQVDRLGSWRTPTSAGWRSR